MFSPDYSGQQPVPIYPPEYGYQNGEKSGRSSGSFDTHYSETDVYTASELYGTADRGSPMSHLTSLQTSSSMPTSAAAALKQFGSLTLLDDKLQVRWRNRVSGGTDDTWEHLAYGSQDKCGITRQLLAGITV